MSTPETTNRQVSLKLFPATGDDGRIKFPGRVLILCLCAALALFIFHGCNPEDWEVVDCSECYTVQPEEAVINVSLTLNNVNRFVVMNLYRGKIEEEILILSDTARTESWSTVVPVNEYYTVTATYYSGLADRNYYNITAIDGGVVRARKVTARCDVPCWIITGNNFNVKLKY